MLRISVVIPAFRFANFVTLHATVAANADTEALAQRMKKIAVTCWRAFPREAQALLDRASQTVFGLRARCAYILAADTRVRLPRHGRYGD